MDSQNQKAPPSSSRRAERVVGIGASAGGLESLEQLFANLSPDTGHAFVIVQHLSPDHRSMMDELLARHSAMPICMVTHGVEVQANHVYLLPPRKELVIKDGHLWLSEKDRLQPLTLPIDKFFRSLALECGAKATAVVLSGTGSDGSRGLGEVKRAGGRVFAEDPETAQFDGMPLSAIATTMVDRVGSASKLADWISKGSHEALEKDQPLDEESPMRSILRLLRAHSSIDFSCYKAATVTRRIERRVALKGSHDIAEYAERVAKDPDELHALYYDLLIGVTRFFRDPECFEFLEQQVIPDLLERTPPEEELRVWVAGCATGEEAYSIAMLLLEAFAALERPRNLKLLATDVHRSSLDVASRGIYGEEQMVHVNEQRRQRFFTQRSDGYQVSQDLRQLIVFAPHDVTKDAPFTKMHLITCRNLLIYLEPAAQQTVLSLFHFGLVPGGVLFLGSSESPGVLADEYLTLDERRKFYRKRRDVRLRQPRQLSLPEASAPLGVPHRVSHHSETRLLSLYDRLLDRWMPPSFLIDEDRRLIDTFAGAERWLRVNKRRPSSDLLELVSSELRALTGGVIRQALRKRSAVRFAEVVLPAEDGSPARYTLCAEPIPGTRSGTTPLLVSFLPANERSLGAPPAANAPLDVHASSEERLQELEGELSYARETLQATVEELQTSNEQLQATNEELVASNEELQSTNEELHSVNEELHSVNAEHQKKIEELRELNADIQHLLEGTDIGTLFLDRELRIRKFTPKVASIFHLQPQDIGRSIGDFSHGLRRDGLVDDLEQVLSNGIAIEDEVLDTDGGSCFLRILPYRPGRDANADLGTEEPVGTIAGVVVTLIDINALKQTRARLAQMSAIVESSDDAIIGIDDTGIITTWNRGAERLYGYTAEQAIDQPIRLLENGTESNALLEMASAIANGGRVERTEMVHRTLDGNLIEVSITMSPVYDEDTSNIVGSSVISRDITELKRVQRQLRARGDRIELLLDSTAEAICGLDLNGVCIFCNNASARLLGYETTDRMVGERLHNLLRPESPTGTPRSESEFPVYRVLRTGEQIHCDEDWMTRTDGTRFQAEYWTHPIRDNGDIVGAVMTFLDITQRKRVETELRIASERREQFLAMLSHELRNPLAAVMSATRVMQSKRSDEGAMDRARGVINRQAKHMACLLEDLLDVSRITRGGIQLRIELVDLRTTAELSIEALAPFLEEREIQLEVELPETPLFVDGDPARLQQIVVNLLSNAARYSPPRTRVILSMTEDRGEIVMRVRDYGSGISQNMLPHIFELFVQSEQGLERARGGLGIGLTLVRKIVDLHGGSVAATSDGIGMGSEFCVRLPRSERQKARSDAPPPSQRRTRSILVVEDQDDAREMLTLLLEAHGNNVFGAADGPAALDIIERERPDAALIDIGLPSMNGYEVARRVRSHPELSAVYLVALTGYGTHEDVRAARDAGFDHHMTKPADPETIQRVLQNIGPAARATDA